MSVSVLSKLRADSLYVTISLADVKDHKITLASDKLSFTGTSNGKSYALELEFVSDCDLMACLIINQKEIIDNKACTNIIVTYVFFISKFKEIETEGSIWNVLPQSIQMKLNKKEASDEFWIRLLKDKHLEKTNVTIDWDRYVDEDDASGNFETSNLEGGNDFGGGGGMGMGGEDNT
jgi:cytosolic prostaglandin-E synthase